MNQIHITFENWMSEVDDILTRRFGLDSNDLPDQLYHDIYDAGNTPDDMAECMLDELVPKLG